MSNVFHQNDAIYNLTPTGCLNHRTCQLVHQHADRVIQLRKFRLQEERELEKVRRKRHLDILDILLLAKVTVCRRGQRLFPKAQSKRPILNSHFSLPRWRMAAACQTRTSVLRWTHLCLEDMTPQPAASPGSSTLWPYTPRISRCAARRSRASWEMKPSSPGLKVSLSIYGLHHNLNMWPNPEVFDPSHFALGSAQHSHAFLPFSGGSR
ncbi:cytochrome P450 4A7-like isoform X1 [Callithrix jacchus]